MKFDSQTYRSAERANRAYLLLLLGVVGLALSAVGLFVDSRQFFHSYLVAFAFWVSIGLGGLFFTMLHHLVECELECRAAEIVRERYDLPAGDVHFIYSNCASGLGHLYEWTDSAKVAAIMSLQQKTGFLNTGFFLSRTLVYFAIWFVLDLHSIQIVDPTGSGAQ